MFKFFKNTLFFKEPSAKTIRSITQGDEDSSEPGRLAKGKSFIDRGNTYLSEGNLNDAAACYKQSVLINSADVQGHINLAYVLGEQRRFKEAEPHLKQVLQKNSDNVDARFMLGNFAQAQGNWEDAREHFSKTLELKPDFDIYYRSLLGLHRYAEAVISCDEVLRITPDDADVHVNRGHALMGLNQCEAALHSFVIAVKLNPTHIDAHFNEGLCRLKIGDYKIGWKMYEWRWQSQQFRSSKRNFPQPLWLGKESLEGKTILLHSEQGLGDTIQFCRYAKLVAAKGARVLLLVPKSITSLLSNLEGVDQILADSVNLPSFDFHCPLLSLPLAFATTVSTVPCTIPYLTASPALVNRLRNELGPDDYFRIGLCWKGSTAYPGDAERSPGIAPFTNLVTHFAHTRAKFYTLLPDSREMFRKIGGEDLGYELDQNSAPFAETAALIMQLDLVITCDTSIGHIASAMGKPVWIVLPFSPDWRWIRDQDDSPWYPNTRLFRQTAAGDWVEVFERVGTRLQDVLGGTSQTVWPATNRPHAFHS